VSTWTWLLVLVVAEGEAPSGVNPVTMLTQQEQDENKTASFQQEIIILQLWFLLD
jgi:hypothetical protein